MAQTNGASVITVWEALETLVNKDQQGFLEETEFNRFAEIAQLNIFNRLFDELKDAKKTVRGNVDPVRDKSRIKRIEEDLSAFSTKATLTKLNGVFNFMQDTSSPSPVARVISITTAGNILLDQSTKKSIEICYDEEKIERVLVSTLSAPSEEFPIALVSNDIHVFPTSMNKIEVRYYKLPESRNTSTGARLSGPPIITGATRRNFELPEHYTSQLVYEMARLIGINLRDADVINYGNQEVNYKKTDAL